jgi:hypothetical protein
MQTTSSKKEQVHITQASVFHCQSCTLGRFGLLFTTENTPLMHRNDNIQELKQMVTISNSTLIINIIALIMMM